MNNISQIKSIKQNEQLNNTHVVIIAFFPLPLTESGNRTECKNSNVCE